MGVFDGRHLPLPWLVQQVLRILLRMEEMWQAVAESMASTLVTVTTGSVWESL